MPRVYPWLCAALGLLSVAVAAQPPPAAVAPPAPTAPKEATASPTGTTARPTGATASSRAAPAPGQAALPEVRVQANEPRFVAPTNRDGIGRIWAPVLINGKGPFRLVLDTGASHSALIERTVVALGIPPEQTTLTRLYGVTGTAIVPSVHVQSMEVGDVYIGATLLPIVADVFGGADGVLGREGLPDKRITADFRHDRLVIMRSHRQRAPPGYTTIHLKLTRMGLLALNTRVGRVYAKAVIDTGAETTIGNLALRDALMRRTPQDAKPAEVIGVTLDVQKGDDIPAPPIQLGGLRVQGVHVTFGDMSLFEHWHLTHQPTLLIGMDVLGMFDVLIIDYRLRQMQVLLRNTGAAPRFDPLDPFGRFESW